MIIKYNDTKKDVENVVKQYKKKNDIIALFTKTEDNDKIDSQKNR